MRRERHGGGRGDLVHPALGNCISGKVGVGETRVDRGHVDDHPALALRDHLTGGGLGAQERALQVDAQHMVKFFGGYVEVVAHNRDARVVHHDIDAAKAGDGRRDQRIDLRFLADISGDGEDATRATQGAGRLSQPCRINIADHHLRALTQETLGAGAANATCRPCDHRNFA